MIFWKNENCLEKKPGASSDVRTPRHSKGLPFGAIFPPSKKP